MIEQSEIEEVRKSGGVGELLGHFFDDQGNPVETTLSDRTLALERDDLEGRRIVAVAGGVVKTRAIRSILQSRKLSGLITDERTARALIADETPTKGGHPSKGGGRANA